MKQVKILITGIGGASIGEQVLKALKLANNNYTIIGTDITELCKNRYDVDFFYQVPLAKDPSYLNTLFEIAIKHNITGIIPGSEVELKLISHNRAAFLDKNIIPFINPQSVIDICLDKFKTATFLKENGFKVPQTILITNKQDYQFINFFPVVLKPSLGGSGSVNTMIAQNKRELDLFGEYMLNIYSEFIIQEYIGTPEEEYTVGVLCSMSGNLINSIVIKRDILSGLSNRIKIKNSTPNKLLGPVLAISSGISQGEVVLNELVSKSCEKLALLLGAASAINIQCRVYQGEVYIFEVNPRFSGTTSLRAMVGYNEPDILIRKEILNEEVNPFFPYMLGNIVRGLTETYIKR